MAESEKTDRLLEKKGIKKTSLWVRDNPPAEPSKPSKSSKSSKPSEPIKKAGPVKKTRPTELVEQIKVEQDVERELDEIVEQIRLGETIKQIKPIKQQIKPIKPTEPIEQVKQPKPKKSKRAKTGIPGFDDLISDGLERKSIILVVGGAGTGKTNFSIQFLHSGAKNGEKGLYITFEEESEQIKRHAKLLGLDFEDLERKGIVKFVKIDIFKVSRLVEAMLLKSTGGLMIGPADLPTIIPRDFNPDRIVVDSLSALSSAFKSENYRYFVFNFFSQLKATGAITFAVSEAHIDPTEYGHTMVEEFLGDGVIVLYNLKHGDTRVRALEVLKLRGTKHEEKIVPFQITDKGIVVYPKQSILTALGGG